MKGHRRAGLSATSAKLAAFVSASGIVGLLPPLGSAGLLRRLQASYSRVADQVDAAGAHQHSDPSNFSDHLHDNPFVPAEVAAQAAAATRHWSEVVAHDGRSVTVDAASASAPVDTSRAARNLVTLLCMFAPRRTAIRVDFFASALTKLLPPVPGGRLGPAEVNGGSTGAELAGPIDCWRMEEFEKVFVHELVHSMRWDVGHVPAAALRPLSAFRIGPLDPRPNEAITEVLADVLHTLHVARHTGTAYGRLLDLERAWAVLQAAKILRWHGFGSHAALLADEGPRLEADTSVFSYYVLRAGLLFHLKKFLDWFPGIGRARADAGEFVRLAAGCTASPAFGAAVDAAMAVWVRPGAPARTLRMTCLELAPRALNRKDILIE